MNRLRQALLLPLALGACSDPDTTFSKAAAQAPFDLQVAAGTTAELHGQCRHCTGDVTYRWSIALGPGRVLDCSAGTMQSQNFTLDCPRPGLWVMRLDVEDVHGPGVPDYVNVTFLPAPDAGSTDAGPADAGPSLDAGPVPDAGPARDAGPVPDAGHTDAGTFPGTLTLTAPDGFTAVTTAIPGDLVEAQVRSPAFGLTCTFAVTGGDALVVPGPSCNAAVYPLAPGDFQVGVTYQNGSVSGHADTPVLHVAAPVGTSVHSTTIAALAEDPDQRQVFIAKGGNSSTRYDPAADSSQSLSNSNKAGLSVDAVGGVAVLGWTGGRLGRYDQRASSPSLEINTDLTDDVTSVATAGSPLFFGADWDTVLLATDGTDLAVWSDAETAPTISSGEGYDRVVRVSSSVSLTLSGPYDSDGFYAAHGHTLDYVSLSDARDFADGTDATLRTSTVGSPFSTGHVAAMATGPDHGGTLWVADDHGHLARFTGGALSRTNSLGTMDPAAPFAIADVSQLALQLEGPYAGDLWVLADGALHRVSAVSNTVGAPPVLLDLDLQATGTLEAIGVGYDAPTPILWVGQSNGLFKLSAP